MIHFADPGISLTLFTGNVTLVNYLHILKNTLFMTVDLKSIGKSKITIIALNTDNFFFNLQNLEANIHIFFRDKMS